MRDDTNRDTTGDARMPARRRPWCGLTGHGLAGAFLLTGCIAMLGAIGAPASAPEAERTIANAAAPPIVVAPSVRDPLGQDGIGAGKPLTALDRGGDDLAKVYRSLNGNR